MSRTCYSRDDETFIFDSVGELFDDLEADGELVVGREYFEADCEHMTMAAIVSVGHLLDQFDEWAYEEVGEIYDADFSSLPQEAKDELRALLIEWQMKHVNLDRYWIIKGKSRTLTVTAEDVEASQ